MTPAFRPLQAVHKASRGFSLVELMVVVAIVGILFSIALPVYRQYLVKANQGAVKAVLLDIASRQEQYLRANGSYGDLSALNYTLPTEVSTYFDVSLTTGTISGSTVASMNGLQSFSVTASGKTGTMQEGYPAAGAATEYSINQFGLKKPVAAWQ